MISQVSIKSLNFTARSHVLAGLKKKYQKGGMGEIGNGQVCLRRDGERTAGGTALVNPSALHRPHRTARAPPQQHPTYLYIPSISARICARREESIT